MTQAIFYREVVPVAQATHGDLCVDANAGHAFAGDTNFVPAPGVEFEKLAWHYPIVFVAQDDGYVPGAILGFGDGDNLFVDESGRWLSEYVPGYVRRYPFILANLTDADTFTLCVDPTYAGCNEAERGERLFLLGGAHSPYLQRMLAFVQQFHSELLATTALGKELKSLDVLEPMQAQVALDSGEKLALGGFHTVSRERLKGLDAATLHRLQSSNALELVYLHLFSLANFGRLMDRHIERHGR